MKNKKKYPKFLLIFFSFNTKLETKFEVGQRGQKIKPILIKIIA